MASEPLSVREEVDSVMRTITHNNPDVDFFLETFVRAAVDSQRSQAREHAACSQVFDAN